MPNILILAGDISDAAQKRRIDALQANKNALALVSFSKKSTPFEHNFPHLDLGEIKDEHLTQRATKIARNLTNILRFVRDLPKLDTIYARNLDMILLAWLCGVLNHHKPHLVYEVLDIHGIFVNGGIKQKLARKLERFVLGRVSRLVVSSPEFLTNYFQPIQQFYGDSSVLENKLWLGPHKRPRPMVKTKPNRAVIRLGWVGNIRCAQSMELLMRVADVHHSSVEIHIHGTVHYHAIPFFDHDVAARKNVFFHGSYAYPDDLKPIYQGCDVVWAQDLWQLGGNSDWLIPNRLYEAAWYGCPSIGMRETMTGRKISTQALGYLIDYKKGALEDLIAKLDISTLHETRQRILALDSTQFQQSSEEVRRATEFANPKGQNLPDFIVIGSMRAGTTALYNLCDQHPEIGVSKVKETDFFIRQKNFARGLKWYQSLFPNTCKVRGEFSPNYTKSGVFEGVPKRMKELIPNVKLIYIARNPVDRAASQYKHSFASGHRVPPLEQLMESHEWEHIVDTSCYYRQITDYMNHFPRSQILILDFRELCEEPDIVLSDIAEFLGVSDVWCKESGVAKNSSETLSQVSPFAFRISNSSILSRLKLYLPRGLKKRLVQILARREARELPNFDATLRNAVWLDVKADVDKFELVSGIRFEPPGSFSEGLEQEQGAA